MWLLASFVLSLISTVCELFFTKKVPCFTLQDIIISGEVSVLAFLSDPSNLWLHIFCSRYGFFSFVLSLISTVCELFFTKKVPCFTLQDIFISGEVLVLAFLSDPSNLWLDIFCSRYGFFSFVLSLISTVCELFFTKKVHCFTLQDIISGEVLVLAFLSDPSNLWYMAFFSFVLSLISTVCELFFTKEVPCFTLQDIFISGEVLVLAFLSDPSNLWLHIFCSRYGFFSFVLSLISTVCELFFTKKVPCFTLQDIFISGEVLVLAFLSDPSNLWLDIFCSRYGFFSFVLSLISTVCELFFTKKVPCFTLQDIISGEVLVLAFLSDLSNLWLHIFCSRYGFFSVVKKVS